MFLPFLNQYFLFYHLHNQYAPCLPFLCLSGVNYVYQFCVGAAKGVLSPFVLQEIIMEALQRLNPAHIHAHLRTPAIHQLVQRCQQAYLQVQHTWSMFKEYLLFFTEFF